MLTVGTHKAKTHLSRLTKPRPKGETVVNAKSCTPVVKLTALDAPMAAPSGA
jgi:antitoxin (DNA-binding transcriptional repressor) of toxin-antitoxin stability system